MESDGHRTDLDLEELVRRHEQALRRFVGCHAATIVRRRDSISDLVQTVFRELLVAGRHATFEHEGQVRNWLFVTARNKLRDRRKFYLRQRRDLRRERPLDVLGDPREVSATVCSPITQAISAEAIQRIERCFLALSAEHREVILLRRIGNLSAAEIGGVIGRGEGATRALLSRALARFSELLQERT